MNNSKPAFAKSFGEARENIIISWFYWHFYEMPKFLFLVWKNYLSFGLNYFSVPLLFLTIFSPWRRYKWNYPRAFSIGGFFETFISNIFSRIMGAMCRFVLIVIGVIAQIFIFILGIIVILFWVLIPLILVVLLFVFIT